MRKRFQPFARSGASGIAEANSFSITGKGGSGGGGAPALDSDAVVYYDAVVAAGGSMDLTSLNATYTEGYVKTLHSNLFAGFKEDATWDLLDEFYLFSGKTFESIMVKAKGTGLLINNGAPFISTDYVAAGAVAGLKSNGGGGSPKSLRTGYNWNARTPYAFSMGAYITEAHTTTGVLMGAYNGSVFVDFHAPAVNTVSIRINNTSPHGTGTGFFVASVDGQFNVDTYIDAGVGSTTNGNGGSASSLNMDPYLWVNNGGSTGTNHRATFKFFGAPITAAQHALIAARVETFMTGLGI